MKKLVLIIGMAMGMAWSTASLAQAKPVAGQLIDLGMCRACASNAALYYQKKPKSKCALLVKAALANDQEAIKKLLEFPDYCEWERK